MFTLLQLTSAEVAAKDRAAVLVNAISKVLAGHADAFAIRRSCYKDLAPFVTPLRSEINDPVRATNHIEQLIRSDFVALIAEAIDTAAINGSGSSNQPLGILNTSGIGSMVG